MVLSIAWEAGLLFESIMILSCLLLAAYGMANLITAIVLWLIAPIKEHPFVMLVYLQESDSVRSLLMSARERLNNSGLHHSTVFVAVDCGLNDHQRSIANEYCKTENGYLVYEEELCEYLKKHSFQNRVNTI